MSIKLEIFAETPAEFVSQLAGMLGVRTLSQGVAAPAPPPAKPVDPVDHSAETPKAEAPKRTRKPAQTGGGMPDEKQEEVDALDTATIEQVKEVLLKTVDELGEEVAPGILATYKAKKISELKPADYAKVIADANKMLEAGKTK